MCFWVGTTFTYATRTELVVPLLFGVSAVSVFYSNNSSHHLVASAKESPTKSHNPRSPCWLSSPINAELSQGSNFECYLHDQEDYPHSSFHDQ